MPRGLPASPGVPLYTASRLSKCLPPEDKPAVKAPSRCLPLTLALLLIAVVVGSAAAVTADAVPGLRLVNLDLTGAGGPLAPQRYAEARSLLLYMAADVLVLHASRGTTQRASGPVQLLARSMRMYSAYLPAGPEAQTGTAILSRHRFGQSTTVPLSPEQMALVTVGAIDVGAGADPLTLVVINAAPAADSDDAEGAVAAAVEGIAELLAARSEGHFVVLASFGSEALAQAALEGLTRAGLADVLSTSGGQAFTFTAARPDKRLDFILTSTNLERAAPRVRVLTASGTADLSQHLPVELTLSY